MEYEISSGLRFILSNASELVQLVGSRIYFELGEQAPTPPYIVVEHAGNVPSGTKTGPSILDEIPFRVNVFGKDKKINLQIRYYVREALDRQTLTTFDIQSIDFDNERMGHNDDADLHHVIQDYTMRKMRDFVCKIGTEGYEVILTESGEELICE